MLITSQNPDVNSIGGLSAALSQHPDGAIQGLRPCRGYSVGRYRNAAETTNATATYKSTAPCLQRYARGGRLLIANFKFDTTNYTEINADYNGTIEASIVAPLVSATPQRITFNGGNNSVVLPAKGYVLSDWMDHIAFRRNDPIEIRIFANRAAQAGFETNDSSGPGTENFHRHNVFQLFDLNPTWTAQNGSRIINGIWLADVGQSYLEPVIGNLSDSIGTGVELGLRQAGKIDVECYHSSDRAFHWADGTKSALRRLVLRTCTHVFSNFGQNDLISDGRTAAVHRDNMLRIGWSFAVSGVRFYVATVTPRTNSTDGWTTVENQTVFNITREAERVAYNDWLRAGAPINPATGLGVNVGTAGALLIGQLGHPFAGVIEIADVMETGRNTGIFKANYTTDGVHPLNAGLTAMGNAYAEYASNIRI